jgi:hypothetical protein
MTHLRFAPRFASSLVILALVGCGQGAGSEKLSSETSPLPNDESTETPAPRRMPSKVGEIEAPSNVSVPFHVLVSNQSFDIPSVDVDVFIDDVHVITGDFLVEGQHTWINFDFEIPVGEHTLRAVSKNGGAERTETFRVDAGERWAVVNFWFYETAQGGQPADDAPDFGIDVYDEQPMFQ